MSVSLSVAAQQRYSTVDAPPEALQGYGDILLAIAGADGAISAAEQEWFNNWAEGIGAPGDLRHHWSSFDYKNADLDALIGRMREQRKGAWKQQIHAQGSINYARALVYDAIRMARADRHYHPDEEDAVHRAASLLHVGTDTARAIESLVDLETAVARLRRSLFQRTG